MFLLSTTPIHPTFGVSVRSQSGRGSAALESSLFDGLYAEHGAVLVQGLHPDPAEFIAITNLLGRDFHPYLGGAQKRTLVSDIENVVEVSLPGEEKGISLHGEQYYQRLRPATLWFFCIEPASYGGGTTLCDGVALWRALPQAIQSRLLACALRIRREFDRAAWQEVWQTNDIAEAIRSAQSAGLVASPGPSGNSLQTTFVTMAVTRTRFRREIAFVNSLLVIALDKDDIEASGSGSQLISITFEDGRPIEASLLSEILQAADSLTVGINWKRGDLLAVDNSRLMHGRNSFSGPRRILSRISGRLCASDEHPLGQLSECVCRPAVQCNKRVGS